MFEWITLDVNDNDPVFSRSAYETSISRGSPVGASVLTVFAEDSDSPINAQISYSLLSDKTASVEHHSDSDFFRLQNLNNGEITLVESIPPNKDRFVFMVVVRGLRE